MKLWSANDRQPAHKAFPKYRSGREALFADTARVAAAGFFELKRNWVIGNCLADEFSRDLILIDLGPSKVEPDGAEFERLLAQSPSRRFGFRSWGAVIEDASPLEPWLADYVKRMALEGAGPCAT